MFEIDLQIVSDAKEIPAIDAFKKWAKAALSSSFHAAEITIRVVDEEEMSHFNETYRHKKGATNVLAFPSDLPEDMDSDLLGDVIICAPVVVKEAKEQGKPVEAHFAHLVIHGCLHLCGYNHVDEKDAVVMEKEEIQILRSLGYPNPY